MLVFNELMNWWNGLSRCWGKWANLFIHHLGHETCPSRYKICCTLSSQKAFYLKLMNSSPRWQNSDYVMTLFQHILPYCYFRVVWYRWEQVQGANWVVWSVQGKVDGDPWLFFHFDWYITEWNQIKNMSSCYRGLMKPILIWFNHQYLQSIWYHCIYFLFNHYWHLSVLKYIYLISLLDFERTDFKHWILKSW